VCCKCKKDCWTFNETVNYERYVHAILGKLSPQLTEEEKLYGWFQQDSATAPTSRVSMQGFVRCLQGQNYQQWHLAFMFARFFFWRCLKGKVYNRNPRAAEELK
jgi:hypothetical protein